MMCLRWPKPPVQGACRMLEQSECETGLHLVQRVQLPVSRLDHCLGWVHCMVGALPLPAHQVRALKLGVH